MIKIKEKLELLHLAKEFEIIKKGEENYYIQDTLSNLYGYVSTKDNEIEYYMGENYGDAWINIERLEKLKNFCEFLIK